jgi:fucose 4-O-acetylase-like acetyltransferase
MSVRPARTEPNNSRLESVDYARGLGIFLVVVGHTLRGVINSGLVEQSPTTQFIDDWIYAFHMPLFFLLSGLFAERSVSKGPRQFVGDKLRTVAYPYLIWSLLQTTVQVLLSRHTNSPASWQDLLLIAYQPPMQFWFLYALFMCFMIFLVCWQTGLGRWGFLGIVIALQLIRLQVGLGPWMVLDQAVTNLPYFAVGVVAHKALQYGLSGLNWPTASALAVIGYGGVTHFVIFVGEKDALGRFATALSGSVATLAVATVLARFRLSWCVQQWGKESLPIFVGHTLASAGFRITLQRFAHVKDPTLHLVGGVVAGLYVPIVLVAVTRYVGFDYLFAWPRSRAEKRRAEHLAVSASGPAGPR